jgi:hypothetical protein
MSMVFDLDSFRVELTSRQRELEMELEGLRAEMAVTGQELTRVVAMLNSINTFLHLYSLHMKGIPLEESGFLPPSRE